ncbi:MAG: HAD hydrolase-like protein [Aestuariivirga sp.]|nr:HAD hydrolase-like protein [Aestuariivirga sp.]
MSNTHFDVIVFDFDGTLVQSAGAKRQAFFDVFPADLAPAVATVLDRDPDGPRQRVIPEMIIEAARIGLPAQTIVADAMIGAYGAAAAAAVDAAPEMPGASNLLKRLSGAVPLYVFSITPHEQLTLLLARRAWLSLFTGIYGYPHNKVQTITNLLTHHGVRPSRLLVVGDGENDAVAAARNGCQFHRISKPEDLLALPGTELHQHA